MMIEITTAGVEKIAELTGLRVAYLREDYGSLDREIEEKICHQVPEYLQKHLNEDVFAFVAVDGDRIVATILLIVDERPINPMFTTGKVGELMNVYTLPDYRKRGIASQLLAAVIEKAQELELSLIDLMATEQGKPLYAKHGFREFSTHYTDMRYVLKD